MLKKNILTCLFFKLGTIGCENFVYFSERKLLKPFSYNPNQAKIIRIRLDPDPTRSGSSTLARGYKGMGGEGGRDIA